jgi:Inner membrane component of T3SS, cytoplasmic domain
MTPVVAAGDTTSGVTLPDSVADPLTVTGAPGGPVPMPVAPPPPTVGSAVPAGDVPAAGLSAAGVPAGVVGATNAVADSAPVDTGTTDSAPPSAAAAVALQPGRVKLTVEQGMTIGKQFVLGDTEMLVGREDEDEQIYPDIDLSDQDEGYVHRRHATLRFENGGLTVTHLGGANKTRLNNRPLPDNAPEAVNLGDKLAFGKVVVRVQPV